MDDLLKLEKDVEAKRVEHAKVLELLAEAKRKADAANAEFMGTSPTDVKRLAAAHAKRGEAALVVEVIEERTLAQAEQALQDATAALAKAQRVHERAEKAARLAQAKADVARLGAEILERARAFQTESAAAVERLREAWRAGRDLADELGQEWDGGEAGEALARMRWPGSDAPPARLFDALAALISPRGSRRLSISPVTRRCGRGTRARMRGTWRASGGWSRTRRRRRRWGTAASRRPIWRAWACRTEGEMADDDKRKSDEKDESDVGLTPAERSFKRMHPNTWRVMEEEKRAQRGKDGQR